MIKKTVSGVVDIRWLEDEQVIGTVTVTDGRTSDFWVLPSMVGQHLSGFLEFVDAIESVIINHVSEEE